MKYIYKKNIILPLIVILGLVLFFLASQKSTITTFQVGGGGYCGDGICQPELGESLLTCPQDCGGGGTTCGNGICDPGETPQTCPQDCGIVIVCGDHICQSPEDCHSCPIDCGGCQGGDGGGNTTFDQNQTQPPAEEPPQLPPEDPTELPSEILSIPPEGTILSLPSGGLAIQLDQNTYIHLFPLNNSNVTIHKISKIDPSIYKILLCNQTSISSYEINITADLAYFCSNYAGYESVDEPTLTIYVYRAGKQDWIPLSPRDVVLDKEKKIVCGNITSTPYMIAGYTITPTATSAFKDIIDANTSINQARGRGMNTTYPEDVLNQAFVAYYSCKYSLASSLAKAAEEALTSFQVILSGIPQYVWIALALSIWVVISSISLWYYGIKKKVKVKIRKK